MIRSWKSKRLKELAENGRSAKIRPDLQARIICRLDAMKNAKTLQNLNVPGFDFHPWQGKPQRYSIHVNGPWCITFEWDENGPAKVDLEQHH